MIAHLRGQVIHARPGEAILDVGGVGYRVAVSLTTFGTMTQGQEAALHTITVVREDAIHLYGFRDMEERETFMRLVEVSGIGPKLALAILSTLTPQRLARAVEEGAITQLTQVPGIGKKGAERMVVELRGKFAHVAGGPPSTGGAAPLGGTLLGAEGEAVSALLNLGFKESQAQAAVAASQAEAGGDLSALIRLSLRKLAPSERGR